MNDASRRVARQPFAERQLVAVTVGVVIPLFNKAAYVERAVLSVLAQTHEDFCLVVVDDGSTDDGHEHVLTIKDPRLRLVRTKHGGPARARNVGIEAIGATWVGLLDADDYWSNRFLQRTVAAATSVSDLSVVFTNFHVEGKADPRIDPLVPEGIVNDYFGLTLNHCVAMNSSVVLLRRDRFVELGGYSVLHRYAEDTDLWFRFACSDRLYYVPEPLCTIDLGIPLSLTKTVPLPERIDALAALLETYETYKRKGRIPAAMRASTARFMGHQAACRALHLINEGRLLSGFGALLTKTRPDRHTWRLYLQCLKRACDR